MCLLFVNVLLSFLMVIVCALLYIACSKRCAIYGNCVKRGIVHVHHGQSMHSTQLRCIRECKCEKMVCKNKKNLQYLLECSRKEGAEAFVVDRLQNKPF